MRLLVLYEALPADEREDAFARLSERRLKELAGEESQTGQMIRSLQRVAEQGSA